MGRLRPILFRKDDETVKKNGPSLRGQSALVLSVRRVFCECALSRFSQTCGREERLLSSCRPGGGLLLRRSTGAFAWGPCRWRIAVGGRGGPHRRQTVV